MFLDNPIQYTSVMIVLYRPWCHSQHQHLRLKLSTDTKDNTMVVEVMRRVVSL
jgi:hypothetical protein